MVADQKRVLHGPGGNDEGLDEIRGAEEEEDDGDGPLGDKSALWLESRRFGLDNMLVGRDDYGFFRLHGKYCNRGARAPTRGG